MDTYSQREIRGGRGGEEGVWGEGRERKGGKRIFLGFEDWLFMGTVEGCLYPSFPACIVPKILPEIKCQITFLSSLSIFYMSYTLSSKVP